MFYGLTIKEHIKENMNNDSDFWSSGMGNRYIISSLLKYSLRHWRKLEEDLILWEPDEIEILAMALSDDELFTVEFDKIFENR